MHIKEYLNGSHFSNRSIVACIMTPAIVARASFFKRFGGLNSK